MKKITVIGPGSWGTALAMVLCDNGHEARLWGNDTAQINEINEQHTNARYLPGVHIPEQVIAYHDLKAAIEGVDTVLMVLPTKVFRPVLAQLREIVKQPITIIHASKGIEPGTHMRISEIIQEEFPAELLKDLVVLSGPSHAEEVSIKQPTTITATSENIDAARYVQDLFSNNNYFRVYTNLDVVGVELGGAIKNSIALAAGLIAGLGYGDNAKAALMTRGLAEMVRLGRSLGANPLTFSGLTGIGDLIVTCTSIHSRNWRAGNMLGKGQSLEDVQASMGMVIEGVRTTEAVYQLAKEKNVDMPIITALYEVLFEGKDPKEGAKALMLRMRKEEYEQLEDLR